jgi:hypothetical protein
MLFKRRRRQSSASRGPRRIARYWNRKATYTGMTWSTAEKRCEGIHHHARWSRRDVDDAKAKDRLPGSARILALPTGAAAVNIHVIFLDYEVDRLDRLRMRATHGATQEMLSWA